MRPFALCVLIACAVGLHCTLPPFLLGVFVLTYPDGPIALQGPDQEALVLQLTIGLGVAAVVEFIMDKVPFLDHVVHVVMLFGAPLVAATLVSMVFTPQCLSGAWRSVFMVVCGAVALSMHGLRSAARGCGTAAHGGILTPVHSLAEDVAAVLLVVAAWNLQAAVAAVLALVLLAVLLILMLWSLAQLVKACRQRPHSGAPQTGLLFAAQGPLASQAIAAGPFVVPPPSAPPPGALAEPLLQG